jgi:beta-lactamase regulating signal transducer with metallopeptidase domain
MPWLSCILSNIALAAALALGAWSVQRVLKWHALARVLWIMVLVKLVTPPLVSIQLSEFPGPLACVFGICSCGIHARTQTVVGNSTPWIILAGWLAGAIAVAGTAWLRWSRFQHLVAKACPAPAHWQTLAARLSADLSVRCPEILAAPGRLPPLVIPGWRQPRMLVPQALLGQLNESQRTALLLHELSHIKRGDHLVRLLETLVGVVYWWLPVVGSIGRQLRACEESCCDAAVVSRLPHGRRDYARLLLDVIDFASPLPRQAVPQGTAMSASNLEQRLRGILDATPPAKTIWPGIVLAAGLACVILPCELHYDFIAQSTVTQAGFTPAAFEGCEPTAASANLNLKGCEPTSEARLPDIAAVSKLAVYCCPQ